MPRGGSRDLNAQQLEDLRVTSLVLYQADQVDVSKVDIFLIVSKSRVNFSLEED